MPTPYERFGPERLREVVNRFVDSAFDDFMIGFLFRDADRARVKEKEFELAARNLGAELAYTGRSLPSAHLPLKIFSGHFDRRLKLLELTFAALDVPLEVSELWLTHDRRMRGAITRDENCEGQGRKLPLL